MNKKQQIERIRFLVREMVKKRIQEMTTTGNVAGYNIPGAFAGNKKTNRKRIKKTAEQNGYTLSSKGKQDIKIKADPLVYEGVSKYKQFKNNPERTSRQKIGIAIREAKKSLKEIDSQLKMLYKFKNEMGYNSRDYWKRTIKDIYRIEEKFLRISQQIREFRS
jgi:hypothetical protein